MMRVAPWMMPHHLEPAEKVFVVDDGGFNSRFRADLGPMVASAGCTLQAHSEPRDIWMQDCMEIGFTFAKEPPARQFAAYTMGNGSRLKIPPNEGNYRAPTQEAILQEDAELVWMQPHMHLRGKSTTYRLTYPDGRSEIALNVPRYDFNWQTLYFLKEPLKLPKGTIVTVETAFDNSPANRANPDPSVTVYWGQQTWDEMVFPSLGLVVDRGVDLSKRVVTPSPRAAKDYVIESTIVNGTN
jgi:hypothetical protein